MGNPGSEPGSTSILCTVQTILAPAGGICFNVLPNLPVIRIPADDMVMEEAPPYIRSQFLVHEPLEPGDDSWEGSRRGRRPRRPARILNAYEQMYMVGHYHIIIYMNARTAARGKKIFFNNLAGIAQNCRRAAEGGGPYGYMRENTPARACADRHEIGAGGTVVIIQQTQTLSLRKRHPSITHPYDPCPRAADIRPPAHFHS